MKKLSLITILALSAYAGQSVELKPLEIRSNISSSTELDTTKDVEIYTAKQIDESHSIDVAEFLDKHTSVNIAPNYGNKFAPRITMRGYSNSNIVIIVDGRRLNSIDSAPQILSSIDVNNIELIEITKSSGVVFNGDNASGGVINITTKEGVKKELMLYGGSFGQASGNVIYVDNTDTLSYNVGASFFREDGYKKINSAGQTNKSSTKNANAKLAYSPREDLELRLNGAYNESYIKYPGILSLDEYFQNANQAGVKENFNKQNFKTFNLGTGVTYEINDDLELVADYFYENKESEFIVSNNIMKYNTNIFKTYLKYEADNLSVIFGADGTYGTRSQDASKYNLENTMTKHNYGVFADASYKLDSSKFHLGYRFEGVKYKYEPKDAENLESTTNLNGLEAGYSYVFNKSNSLFASYALAFETPNLDTFFKAEYDSSYNFKGMKFNEIIDPMTSNTVTLGYNFIKNDYKLRASVFYAALKNEIFFNPANYENTNIDQSNKYGLELLETWIANEKFDATFVYNYTKSTIVKENGVVDGYDSSFAPIKIPFDYADNTLPLTPEHTLKFVFNMHPNKYTTLNLTQTYRSEAYAANDFNNNFTQKQDAFYSTDIGANYKRDSYEVFAKVNNLFNQRNGIWVRNDAIYTYNSSITALAGLKYKF